MGVEKAGPSAKHRANVHQSSIKAPHLALRPNRPQTRSDQLAERKAAEQDVFLREVDEAVRQDDVADFVKRFGLPLGVAVVAGLLALAGYLWWDGNRKDAIGQEGEKFVVALDHVQASQLGTADKELAALAKDGSDGSAAAARLMRGGLALEQNRPGDAVKLFAEVAADADAPQPLRDLATVREVSLRFDTVPPQQVVDRLKALAVPGNPWFGSAGELVGMAYLKQGKPDLAGPLFAAISRDKDTPETLRRRARQLAGLLGVDAIDDVAKAAAEQGAPAAPQ